MTNIRFVLNGCDISFIAEAPEDITLKELLVQTDKIKPNGVHVVFVVQVILKKNLIQKSLLQKIQYNLLMKMLAQPLWRMEIGFNDL